MGLVGGGIRTIQKCLNYSTKTCLALAKKRKLTRHTLCKMRTFSRVASEQQGLAQKKKNPSSQRTSYLLNHQNPNIEECTPWCAHGFFRKKQTKEKIYMWESDRQ